MRYLRIMLLAAGALVILGAFVTQGPLVGAEVILGITIGGWLAYTGRE